MIALYLLPVLAVTVILTIYAQVKNDIKKLFIFKPASTIVIIAAAVVPFIIENIPAVFGLGIIIGLGLSLGGDVLLIYESKEKTFIIGLVLFLLAQVSYAFVFFKTASFTAWDIVTAAALALMSVWFYRKAKAGLGDMKFPVIVYMIIICFMVNRACALVIASQLTQVQSILIAAGAVLFLVSDIVLAYNKFVKKVSWKPQSLALYFLGQYCIALSLSFF
jgi:uncharacterized membrane protein YhhN